MATIDSILAASIATAKAATAATTDDKVVQPTIILQADAMEAADRRNQVNQAVIRAKEGATDAIVKKVGHAITNTVLQSDDGSDVKGIDDYELYELVDAIIRGANRPPAGDVLKQLLGIIEYAFDWRQPASTNVGILRAKADRLQAYGVDVTTKQVVVVIMANVELAAREAYGTELKSSLQMLRRAYAYDYSHDDASLQTILTELAAADAVRRLRDAPAPNHHGTANAVQENYQQSLTRLQQLMHDTADDEASRSSYGTAYSASRRLQYNSSGDESTVDIRRSRKTTARSTDRRDRSPDQRNNRSPNRRNNCSPDHQNNCSPEHGNNCSPD